MSVGTGTSPFSLSSWEEFSNTTNSITENRNDRLGDDGLNQWTSDIQNWFPRKNHTFPNASKTTGLSIIGMIMIHQSFKPHLPLNPNF
ncbi:hypothetical protein BT96DRAFT_427137 [Gymnopus androsaceus JB14]|uniref:Uncharacterized protein n=1 Tax=Gymnopus androsaceus JB14 TaxID=1447944 RepID=A0A6A4I6J2_9AGAR|nr:hypothetical protein BT96DRAFT_427137 [Gymnopus androsaceus JB14]